MQLTPLTSVSLVVSEEWQRFDLSPDRDSDTFRITPMVSFSPGGLLNGSAAIGYRRFSGRSAELPDFSGLVAVVNVSATIVGRHRLDTSFSRTSATPDEEVTPYYLSTGGTVTLTSQVSGPFDVRVTGTLQSLDYSHSNAGQAPDSYPSVRWRRGLPHPANASRRDSTPSGRTARPISRPIGPSGTIGSSRPLRGERHHDHHSAVALAGSGQTQAPSTPGRGQQPSRQTSTDYIVGPQDVLKVTVFGVPELTRDVTVDADGTFDFPLVGRIKAAGQTVRAVEAELKAGCRTAFWSIRR